MPDTVGGLPAVLTDTQVVELLGTTRMTLSRMRDEGTSPPYFTVRGRRKYRRASVLAWIENQENKGAGDVPSDG